MTSHGLNVSSERLETLFWTSRLGLVSVSRLWRLDLVSVSASYVSFPTLMHSLDIIITVLILQTFASDASLLQKPSEINLVKPYRMHVINVCGPLYIGKRLSESTLRRTHRVHCGWHFRHWQECNSHGTPTSVAHRWLWIRIHNF